MSLLKHMLDFGPISSNGPHLSPIFYSHADVAWNK